MFPHSFEKLTGLEELENVQIKNYYKETTFKNGDYSIRKNTKQ